MRISLYFAGYVSLKVHDSSRKFLPLSEQKFEDGRHTSCQFCVLRDPLKQGL